MTNYDIERIVRRLDLEKFRGVFSKDRLPTKPLGPSESVIVNLQEYNAGRGTHWVCARRSSEGGVDYFGLPPPEGVKSWMERAGGRVMYSGNEVQDRRLTMCGWYWLLFLFDRARGRPVTDVLLDFDTRPSERNERIVRDFAQRLR